MILEIHLPNGMIHKDNFPSGISAEAAIKKYQKEISHEIFSCRIDGVNERLDKPITKDCQLDLLDITDPYANMVYQSSLTMLYITAIKLVLGHGVETTIKNSLSKGLFTTLHIGNVTDELSKKIMAAMRDLVNQRLPLSEKKMSRKELIDFLKKKESRNRLALYESTPELNEGYLYQLMDKQEIFYIHLVPNTSYLKIFEVRRYRNGLLLRYPYPDDPEHLKPYEEQRKMYEAFSEESQWEKLLGIRYAADLNKKVDSKDFLDIVLLSEALHEKKIAEIASKIKETGKRIILIAGPSSSGKTTFAKRLCIQLRVLGLRPLYLGTDDYFKERDQVGLLPNGKKDFESLNAVDVALFSKQMNELLSGKKVDLPEFDFIDGKKIYGKRITSIENSQPIVIEGIHGLNPKMTEGIEDLNKFKIYISPLTSLNIDIHHRVPTTDARMLRRLVRDYRTRGRSASDTIHDWPEVRAGEDVNIFPYNSEADVFFNSQCIYELAVLKKYAEPLLKEIQKDQPEYPEAQRMLLLTRFFVAPQDNAMIPNNSIIREFIGGSVILGN